MEFEDLMVLLEDSRGESVFLPVETLLAMLNSAVSKGHADAMREMEEMNFDPTENSNTFTRMTNAIFDSEGAQN